MKNKLTKEDFYYNLPNELIAQHPMSPRDASRLIVYDRNSNSIYHKQFYNIIDFLKKGDVLVINNTKVMPARIFAFDQNARKFETLLLKRINYSRWEVLMKPAKKARIGQELIVNEELSFRVISIEEKTGIRIIEFRFSGVFENILSKVGTIPLPPYITEKLQDASTYQTIYAKTLGSSAAPTAGLHFTDALFNKIKSKGIDVVEVLLHVGLGTFRPVKCSDIEKHVMHSEYFEISKQAADTINKAKSEGRRIIAVGTTSVRILESALNDDGLVVDYKGETNIFIYPPYNFRVIDGLITNFHLPESTLLMLVSAFIGRTKALELYKTAIEERYRFFSFGDAMFLIGRE